MSEQKETVVATEVDETQEFSVEAEGGSLIVTLSGIGTLPPGTFISITLQVPEARQGGMERPDE